MTGFDAILTYETDPYKALASAVIVQAADDYRRALKMLKKNPKSVRASGTINSLERFFHSESYMLFTNLNGDTLLEMIKKEECQ